MKREAMTESEAPTKTLLERLEHLALELNFVQAGTDAGLLPINSFVATMEEALKNVEAPEAIRSGMVLARSCLDRVFDTTATLDAETIAFLGSWQAWMSSATKAWSQGQPCPPIPAFSQETKTQGTKSPEKEREENDTQSIPEPSLLLNLESDCELLREFINESQEHLQNIENGVLVLEENPTDADTLNSIFRAFHTFKGGSGFLNLNPIKNLAHELESLLDAARQQRLVIDGEIIDLILEGGDLLKLFVATIAAQLNGVGAGDAIQIPTLQFISRVQHVMVSRGADGPKVSSALTAGRSGDSTKAPVEMPLNPEKGPSISSVQPADQEGLGGKEYGMAPPNDAETPLSNRQPDTKPPAASPILTGNSIGSRKSDTEKASNSDAASVVGVQSGSVVKVDTLKLDSLIDLVGELVISQSMVVQDRELLSITNSQLTRNLAQLRRITSELQRTAMSLRMIPIRGTFQKMTRLVRDLAAKQQKQIQLLFSGEDTELDRNIVEALGDPLVHMIRNSVDHGLETPESRLANGKPAMGTIHLRAFHQGGSIVIQIEDDGAGVNKERILKKAVEKGMLRGDEVLSDRDIYALIFAAGFSTAEKVTELSGRGVGMDVVRKNIEQLRGKVEIESTLGKGTTFSIFLPLTLAIIDGMIVSVGDERYIIPTLSVRESFRPRREMISTVHNRVEMVNVRGRQCPLLRLYQYFDQPPKVTDPTEGIVIVVESGTQIRCLMVDELLGKQEVVIKTLGETFKSTNALAGGAVLGDGRVGLILDVDSLVRLEAPVSLTA